jgi:hypothetical protein
MTYFSLLPCGSTLCRLFHSGPCVCCRLFGSGTQPTRSRTPDVRSCKRLDHALCLKWTFLLPITQLAVSGDNLLAVTSGGYWISPKGDTWNVINRLPPDMLATTGDGIFIFVPGNGLMETINNGQFSTIRSLLGVPVTDLSEIDDELYAANESASIFSASEAEKVWKRLPVVSQAAKIRSVTAVGENLYAGTGPRGELYQSTVGVPYFSRGSSAPSRVKLVTSAAGSNRLARDLD